MKTACVLLLAAAVTACASGPPKAWYKPGATERDFNIATARCRMGRAALPQGDDEPYRTRGVGDGMVQAGREIGAMADRAQYLRDCMTAQGWDYR